LLFFFAVLLPFVVNKDYQIVWSFQQTGESRTR